MKIWPPANPVCRWDRFSFSLLCFPSSTSRTSVSRFILHLFLHFQRTENLSATTITHSTRTPRQVSCKVKLSCQKSSQLPTAVARVSEPVLLCCFLSVWVRSLILNRALSFPPDPDSPAPRAAMCTVSYRNTGAIWVESLRFCPPVTLTLIVSGFSFSLWIFHFSEALLLDLQH